MMKCVFFFFFSLYSSLGVVFLFPKIFLHLWSFLIALQLHVMSEFVTCKLSFTEFQVFISATGHGWIAMGSPVCVPSLIILFPCSSVLHPVLQPLCCILCYISRTPLSYKTCVSLYYSIVLESVTAKMSEKKLQAGKDKFRQSKPDKLQSWGLAISVQIL